MNVSKHLAFYALNQISYTEYLEGKDSPFYALIIATQPGRDIKVHKNRLGHLGRHDC